MRNDRDRLLDVLEAIARIRRHTTGGRSSLNDEPIETWVLHNLQIMGEAVRGLSEQVRSVHPEVSWAQIVGMRDVIVHGYFGIDVDLTRTWSGPVCPPSCGAV